MEAKTNSGYITIAEYAQCRGVSVAAVYKRLDGTLKEYVKEINGKKFLAVEVLAAEGIKPVEKGIKPGIKPQESQDAPKEETMESQGTPPPAIQVALEALQQQLAAKDQQIERLQDEAAELRKANAEKDLFIRDQASRLTLLLEQSQELQKNNQYLLGLAQVATPATAESKNTSQESQDAPGSATEHKEVIEIKEKKAGFWRRLFGV